MEQNTLLPATQANRNGELAATAAASGAKALIEAKFTVALHRPRSELNARAKILDACKRSGFAENAKWEREQGWDAEKNRPKIIDGFTIRFAETAIQCWGNVDTTACITWDDDDKRMVRITVTDLETNISYTDELVLEKTVERNKVKDGVEILKKRTNSKGKDVFIIRATEDELIAKVNKGKSQSIRTNGLRLLPQDILAEAWAQCIKTMSEGDKDSGAAVKKIADAFASIGVSPSELEKYLGHSLTAISPGQLKSLRKIYAAINEGEADWSDYSKTPKAGATLDVEKEKDDIPMGDSKKEEPAKKSEDKSDLTPHAKLATILTKEGITVDTFMQWAQDGGQYVGAVPGGIDELDSTWLARWMKNEKVFGRQVEIMKGGVK